MTSDDAQLPDGFPRSGEDRLLELWWQQERAGRGLLVLEVKLGQGLPGSWQNRRSHRRLDGLYLPDAGIDSVVWWNDLGAERLEELITDRPATLLESKDSLNTDVIGQVVAGVDMLSRSYPTHGRIDTVATVWAPTDPALRWVCNSLGIEVFAPPRT